MKSENEALQQLIDKEAVRELIQLYSRGVDRKDPELLRDLYTAEATDTHGDTYDGDAQGYVDFLEQAFPFMRYSGHHICNELISIDGDKGEGEIYAVAWHVIPNGNDGWVEDLMTVRYIDNYQRCDDGRWRFSKRVVNYDFRRCLPIPSEELFDVPETDPSAANLSMRLFLRGKRG